MSVSWVLAEAQKNQLENATQIHAMTVSIGPCTLVGMIGGRSISAKRKNAMLMNTKGHNSGPSIDWRKNGRADCN